MKILKIYGMDQIDGMDQMDIKSIRQKKTQNYI